MLILTLFFFVSFEFVSAWAALNANEKCKTVYIRFNIPDPVKICQWIYYSHYLDYFTYHATLAPFACNALCPPLTCSGIMSWKPVSHVIGPITSRKSSLVT